MSSSGQFSSQSCWAGSQPTSSTGRTLTVSQPPTACFPHYCGHNVTPWHASLPQLSSQTHEQAVVHGSLLERVAIHKFPHSGDKRTNTYIYPAWVYFQAATTDKTRTFTQGAIANCHYKHEPLHVHTSTCTTRGYLIPWLFAVDCTSYTNFKGNCTYSVIEQHHFWFAVITTHKSVVWNSGKRWQYSTMSYS